MLLFESVKIGSLVFFLNVVSLKTLSLLTGDEAMRNGSSLLEERSSTPRS